VSTCAEGPKGSGNQIDATIGNDTNNYNTNGVDNGIEKLAIEMAGCRCTALYAVVDL
jgi:hypothetical protein